MATANFIDRFKNKVSTVGKSGELDINVSRPIVKASSAQFHKSIMQLSASNIIRNNLQSPTHPPLLDSYKSARPIRVDSTEDYQLLTQKNADDFSSPSRTNVLSGTSSKMSGINETEKKPRRKHSHSATPVRKEQLPEVPKTSDGVTQSLEPRYSQRTQNSEFSPYTLQDYQVIKTDKYYELGGLGPINVGTED